MSESSAHDEIMRALNARGWRFRLRVLYWRYVRYPREMRQWKKACKVIEYHDYYVISDHDFFAGVEAGLWKHEDYQYQEEFDDHQA